MFLTLCVVVVTTSAWSKGDGIIFAATSPLMCAMSANRYAPLWSFARKVSVSYGQQSADCGGWEILTSVRDFAHAFEINLTWNSRATSDDQFWLVLGRELLHLFIVKQVLSSNLS